MTVHTQWHQAAAAAWSVIARNRIRDALKNANLAPRDPVARRLPGNYVSSWDGIRVMHGQHVESVLLGVLGQNGWRVNTMGGSGGGFHHCDSANKRLAVSCIRGWNRKVTTTDKAYMAVVAEAAKHGREAVLMVFYDYHALHTKAQPVLPYPPGVYVVTNDATDAVFDIGGLGLFMRDHMREFEAIMEQEA